MTRLDVSDGFDVHDYRSKLKLVRQDRGTMYLENRNDCRCPACEQPFERLFVSEKPEVSFGSAPNGPICLVRTDDELLVLTH